VASPARRPLLALLAAVTAALAVAGCVSMPSAGPVLSYPVTQATGSQNGQSLEYTTQPPGSTWNPGQIVNGFLIAAAASQDQVARQYLTPAEGKSWDPSLTTYVYQTRPNVLNPVPLPAGPPPAATKGKKTAKPPQRASVEVNGKIQAVLSTLNGTYQVPSASGPNSSGPKYFGLVKTAAGWRISAAPSALLLTPAQFGADYDLRNLYFFDPNYRYLVPDPVYVPLLASASTLTKNLVTYLTKPPTDWLAGGATETALPLSTKVTLADNLATVNVTGTVTEAQRSQISSQLLWTLVGSGQGGSQVNSVALFVNGKPFYPANSTGNYVQNQSEAVYGPAGQPSSTAASKVFYYLGSGGEVYSTHLGVTVTPTPIAKIGAGYSQIAVSKDGKYLAALRANGGQLFIGPIHGPLVREQGSDYVTLSWDPSDNLWTTTSTNDQIFVFRAGANANTRQAKPIVATVTSGRSIVSGEQYTALQIAPDGVRVAMILNNDELTFGAIVWEPGTGPGPGSARIQLSPFYISNLDNGFNEVTWYGPDNVITLGGPGSTLTEYPVDGGTPTSQMLNQAVETITAATSGQALIAGIAKNAMIEASNLTQAWAPIVTDAGTSVVGNSPTYPG
jgi:Lipoprotein LpqB beta-propeller domain/Sporulation and spore germination